MNSSRPSPWGAPLGTACFKQQPEDFRVRELLGFEASGQGEHLLLRVEKRGMTTHELIDELARSVGIPARQIGYAGLKDKQAVTEQWLSLQLPGQREIPEFPEVPDWRVLEAHWHDRKLRVGAHRGNAFVVLLRQVEADRTAVEERLSRIRRQGFANYFGEQRFGRGGDNVARALKALAGTRSRKRLSRNRCSLYISSLRSELFNRVLARRIEQGIWEQPLEGDVWMLDGSGSWFSEEADETLLDRYRNGDLHSGIGLYGRGESPLAGPAAALEQSVYAEAGEMVQCLKQVDARYGLRPHRARATDLDYRWQDERTLQIRVHLGRGSYLTSLLEQVFDLSSS